MSKLTKTLLASCLAFAVVSMSTPVFATMEDQRAQLAKSVARHDWGNILVTILDTMLDANGKIDAAQIQGALSMTSDLTLDDGSGASPNLVLQDAASPDGTLVLAKPSGSAATVTATIDGLTLSVTADNKALTLQTQAGSPDAGDDIVIDCDNFAVAAGGAVTWPGNAGSLATKAATALTIYGGNDGADAGEDVIIVSESWGVDVNGDLLFDDDATDSPKATWTDASAGTLVIYKPDASAATVTTTTDGLTLSCTTDNAVMTLQGQAGSPDAGDDLVLDFDNFALTAAGAASFPGQAGSIATKADTALTLTGGDDGGSAGEDVVIDGDNFAVAAGGAVTWPGNAGSLATKADTALTITGGDDGAASGEDVIVVSHAWGVDANGDILFDDDTTDSPKATWTDATAGALVVYKPDGAAASITSSTDGVIISSTEDNADVTLQAQAGSPDAGDDLVLDFDNIALDAAGALTWPGQAGSLATKAATALTIYGGDDGADSGEDVIIDSVDWGVTADGLRTIETNIGTAGSGCTVTHWGDGKHIMAEITITTASFDVAATAAEGHGYLIYTLPAGACVITNSYLDYELTTAGACSADTPESALGSVIGAGAIATLTATTMEDISATGDNLALADCSGTAEVSSAGPSAANGKFVVETGDAHTVHVNFADNWTNTDDAILLTGTVRLTYTYMD